MFLRSKIQRVIFAALLFASPAYAALNVERLAETDIQKVKGLLNKLDPVIKERDKKHTLATLTFDDFYASLDKKEKNFLKEFQNLEGKKLGVKIPFRGIATGKENLVMVTGQVIKVRDHKKEGTDKDFRELPPQFLPPKVDAAFQKMIAAMEKEIGKKFFIESGYRSSAYQLYLFVYYLKNHDYSIRETVKFVALPGYSEHGSPAHQAVDLINPDGINGEDNPQEFEELPENAWLLKNAKEFGFVLSYPKKAGSGITYEPWHWRYEGMKTKGAPVPRGPSAPVY